MSPGPAGLPAGPGCHSGDPPEQRDYLAESRFRLAEILLRTGESGQCEDLLAIDAPADLADREPGWFTSWGAYLWLDRRRVRQVTAGR